MCRHPVVRCRRCGAYPILTKSSRAITEGTVRAAATLRAQSPSAREAIRAALRDTVAAHKRGDSFEYRCPPYSPQLSSRDATPDHLLQRDDAQANAIVGGNRMSRKSSNLSRDREGEEPSARLPTLDSAPHGRAGYGAARELGHRLLVHVPRLTASRCVSCLARARDQRRRDAMTKLARRRRAPGLLAFEGDDPSAGSPSLPEPNLLASRPRGRRLASTTRTSGSSPVSRSQDGPWPRHRARLDPSGGGICHRPRRSCRRSIPARGRRAYGRRQRLFRDRAPLSSRGVPGYPKATGERPRNWVPRVTMRINAGGLKGSHLHSAIFALPMSRWELTRCALRYLAARSRHTTLWPRLSAV